MKMETQRSKIYGMQQISFKREVHSNTGQPQETRKISNKQPKFTPKKNQKKKKIQSPELVQEWK